MMDSLTTTTCGSGLDSWRIENGFLCHLASRRMQSDDPWGGNLSGHMTVIHKYLHPTIAFFEASTAHPFRLVNELQQTMCSTPAMKAMPCSSQCSWTSTFDISQTRPGANSTWTYEGRFGSQDYSIMLDMTKTDRT